MTGNRVFVVVALLPLLCLLCLCLSFSALPVPGFVRFLCLCLGLLPSLFRLLYLSYTWGLSAMPVSGSSTFSAMSAVSLSTVGLSTSSTTSAVPLPSSCLYLALPPSLLCPL